LSSQHADGEYNNSTQRCKYFSSFFFNILEVICIFPKFSICIVLTHLLRIPIQSRQKKLSLILTELLLTFHEISLWCRTILLLIRLRTALLR